MSSRRRAAVALAVLLSFASLVQGAGAAAVAPATPRGIPPANDDFSNALPVGPLPATKTADTAFATTETSEPTSLCNGSTRTVWYKLTPATDTVVSVDTLGSSINTGVTVWRGATFALLTEVACSSGAERGTDPEEMGGRTAFRAKAGVKYVIQIDSQEGSGAGGPITLHVKVATPPANDQFVHARTVSLPFHTVINNGSATFQSGEPAQGVCDAMRATVWYRIHPAANMAIRADTFGSPHDTMLAVFTGTSLADLTYKHCDDDTSFMNANTHQSSVTWRAKAGKTYWLEVGGYRNEWGPIDLTIQQVSPPANDQRAAAVAVTSLPFSDSVSNRNATRQRGEVTTLCGPNPFIQSVWYRWTADTTVNMRAIIDGEAGSGDMVAMFTGSTFDDQVELACKVHDTISFTPVMATTYFFLVGGDESRSGPMQFSLELAP